MEKTLLVVIAGPSAGGKTVVTKSLLESDSRFTYLRSATTREMREDLHREEYLYCSEEEFKQKIANGEFVEYTNYGGNYYGTPVSEIERAQKNGKIPLLVLDLKGVENLSKSEKYRVFSAYLFSDLKTLEQRLYDRYLGENPTVSGLKKYMSRKTSNESDYLSMERYAEYFYTFVDNSNSLDECKEQLLLQLDNFLANKPKNTENIQQTVEALAHQVNTLEENR